MRAWLLAFVCVCVHAQQYSYSAVMLDRKPAPALSNANPKGSGYSPCEYTFNPGWIPTKDPSATESNVIVRAANCPAEFGGSTDHLLLATCYSNGTCDDITEPLIFPFEESAQDPRLAYVGGWWYLFYFANGANESTVYLRKTQTPSNLTSWERVGGPLPWHRNGCVLQPATPPYYILFGESPPLPGVGIAATTDFTDIKTVNATLFKPTGSGDTEEPEIVIEASTPVVQLSTGDYFHIYSAGTPGWVANGNYTGGWVVLDKENPTIIKQRSPKHFIIATTDYEIGNGPYPVQRERTIFATSLIPTGVKDQFRVWYGAADANVASAIVQVSYVTV